MAKKTIDIGSVANDGTGTPLRTAFGWINDNFTELYSDDTGDVNSVTGSGGLTASPTTGAVSVSITDGGVTNAKMAANSIDSDQYVDGSIDTEHFSLTAAINTVTDQNTGALKLWSGSQAQYDALTPDASTIYFIV